MSPIGLILAALLVSSVLSATTTTPLPEQPSYRGNGTILNFPLSTYNWGTGSYFLSSTLGTPPQSLNLTLVLNANGLIVPSVGCVSTPGWDSCQQEASAFSTSASSSFMNVTSTPASLIVDATISGQAYLGTDTFTVLGSGDSGNYAVESQALAVTTEAGGIFYYDGSQGLFGLGIESTNFSSTLLGSRLQNGSLNSFTVGIDLDKPDFSHRTSSGGVLNWGGVDLEGRSSSTNSGSLTWVPSPADFDGWWIALDGMSFNGHPLTLGGDGTSQMARLETWSNSLVLPASVYNQIFGPQVSTYTVENNYWLVPCDQIYNISFTIGGTQFDLDAHEFVNRINDSACRSSILGWWDQSTENIYQLGTPFLRAVYTALHIARSNSNPSEISKVVGFSQKPVTFAPSNSSSSSPTPNASPEPSRSSSHTGAIAGGVVGGVVLLLSLSLVSLFLLLSRRKHRRQQDRPPDPTNAYASPLNANFVAQHGSPSPSLPSFSPFPSPPPMSEASVVRGGTDWDGREMSGVPVGGRAAPLGRDGRGIPELG